MTITRRYWQCRCGADGGYAADEVIGLAGRYSKVVQKHSCRLAADVSFAQASEHLREMLSVRLSPETVRGIAESHGKAMATFQPKDEATAQAFREAKGEVEFAVDAGKVNTREKSWKDLKIVVISKRESGGPATPSQWCDEDRLPAATIVVAFAMIAASRVFRRCWKTPLKRLGVTLFTDYGGRAMGKKAKHLDPTITHALQPERTTCVHCDGHLRADYTNHRTLHTLQGVTQLDLLIRRCRNPHSASPTRSPVDPNAKAPSRCHAMSSVSMSSPSLDTFAIANIAPCPRFARIS